MEDNLNKAEREIQEIFKKYNVRTTYVIEFPIYRQIPDEVKLALSVLNKHGMKITFILKSRAERK